MDLPTSVARFILRSASLFGIESIMCPVADRRTHGGVWRTSLIGTAAMTNEIGLAEVIEAARDIVEEHVRGRIVVKIG